MSSEDQSKIFHNISSWWIFPDIDFIYILLQPSYGMFLVPPSTDKSSGVCPLPLLDENSPNSHFFLWQTSRYVKMETRLQSRCRGCNPFSLFPSFPQSWTTQRPGWRRSTLWCTGCPRRTGRCWSCWWDTWPRRLTTHDCCHSIFTHSCVPPLDVARTVGMIVVHPGGGLGLCVICCPHVVCSDIKNLAASALKIRGRRKWSAFRFYCGYMAAFELPWPTLSWHRSYISRCFLW